MGETASISLEAKAAILAAVYAFQRLTSASGQQGTELANFNSVFGVSIKLLQQYQYAARQVGVSNQEVANTFKNIQSQMAKIRIGEGAPKWMGEIARLTGNIEEADIERFVQHPELFIQRLQQYAARETNIGTRNEVLSHFAGDGMKAALVNQVFRPDILQKAPTYKDKEVANLNKANIAWSNLGTTIEMAFGKFNAAHGLQLVKDLTNITMAVVKLSEALVHLSEKFGIFEKISKSISGFTYLLSGGVFEDIDKAVQAKGIEDPDMLDRLKVLFEAITLPDSDTSNVPKSVAPNAPAIPPQSSNTNQNININQNLNFQHDGKNAKEVGDSTKKAVAQAYRQSPALVQVT